MSGESVVDMEVGVRRLQAADERLDLPRYEGISYCDAMHRAAAGETLRILPGSIRVCQWAPVVLGLCEPQGAFERGLAPRLPFPVAGLLLAPLAQFPGQPEVVVVRDSAVQLRRLVDRAVAGTLWDGHQGRLDCSALPVLIAGQGGGRSALVDGVNHLLAALAPSSRWQAFTRWLFGSRLATASLDALISRTLADMSVCRNSTVVPLLTGRVNVSYFCTGGVTWGGNRADHLTSGWPPEVWAAVRQGETG